MGARNSTPPVIRTPDVLDPCAVLGISKSATPAETKAAYKKLVTNSKGRQDLINGAIAYHMVSMPGKDETRYDKQKVSCIGSGAFFYAIVGHTKLLLKELEKDLTVLTSVDAHKRSLLYITARSGFYDATLSLLLIGASPNQTQVNGSTPLHGAAFYGHKSIVSLLLAFGADPTIKNQVGSAPIDEASSKEITKIFEDFENDCFGRLVAELRARNLIEGNIRPILFSNGSLVGREIRRCDRVLQDATNQGWNEVCVEWEEGFHGTKYKVIKSIMENGLLPSGSKLPDGTDIEPPPYHIAIDTPLHDKLNWAHSATFLSPSFHYSANPSYADRMTSNDTKLCVVIKALVKPGSYSDYPSTVPGFKEDGELKNVEYRIESPSNCTEAEVSRNVLVVSVLLIDEQFVDDCGLKGDDMNSVFKRKTISEIIQNLMLL